MRPIVAIDTGDADRSVGTEVVQVKQGRVRIGMVHGDRRTDSEGREKCIVGGAAGLKCTAADEYLVGQSWPLLPNKRPTAGRTMHVAYTDHYVNTSS
jgi:hypothetical protein